MLWLPVTRTKKHPIPSWTNLTWSPELEKPAVIAASTSLFQLESIVNVLSQLLPTRAGEHASETNSAKFRRNHIMVAVSIGSVGRTRPAHTGSRPKKGSSKTQGCALHRRVEQTVVETVRRNW